MVKKHEKLAGWINDLSLLGLLGLIAFAMLTHHGSGPLPGFVLVLLLIGLVALAGSCFYLKAKPQLSPARKKQELLETVHFYRQLGFFSEFNDRTDGAVAAELNARWRKLYGESFDPTTPEAELVLLSLDESRVWESDLKCDVAEVNQVYRQLLKRLGAISRGAFLPQNIKETWETDKGPIHVEFSLNGVAQTLHPKYRGARLDTDFLFKVAGLFKGGSYELAVHPGDPIYATVLSRDERGRIRHERGSLF